MTTHARRASALFALLAVTTFVGCEDSYDLSNDALPTPAGARLRVRTCSHVVPTFICGVTCSDRICSDNKLC